MLGAAVFTSGDAAVTGALAGESAVTEPDSLAAPTRSRSVKPMSALAGRDLVSGAPRRVAHSAPAGVHRSHWELLCTSAPPHVPRWAHTVPSPPPPPPTPH